MPIRAAASSIKGTTRVSFGDKQLIKRLWINDKNSTQAKNQRSREINKADKERLTRTVQRRSIEAFQTLSKQMRSGSSGSAAFEYKDGVDDRPAVQAMCDKDWTALARRHERATNDFSAWCDSLARNTSVETASQDARNVAKLLARNCAIDDVPLLHARKHKRACNFRAKEAKRRELLLDYPLRKQSIPISSNESNERNASNVQIATTTTTTTCDPVPRRDYERNDAIAYTCFACAQPVCSSVMVVLPNGAHDALYLHRECDAQRRALQTQARLSRRSLLGNLPFQTQ
jgi:hypothetical protein